MTNEDISFDEWHAALEVFAKKNNGSAADADAWREDYDAGKTPEQAWVDEWGHPEVTEDEPIAKEEDATEQEQPIQLDPEVSKKVAKQMQEYVNLLNETEPKGLVDMAVLNIRMENFRRTMQMSGAPPELSTEFLNIMQSTLDMMGDLIDMETIGGERFVSVRNDIVTKGDGFAKAALAEKQ